MPSFSQLSDKELDEVTAYVASPEGEAEGLGEDDVESLFLADGYLMFRDDEKTPLIKPPWGTLNAIDLLRGEILWRVPLGEYPHLVEKGIRNTGTLNYGGPVDRRRPYKPA